MFGALRCTAISWNNYNARLWHPGSKANEKEFEGSVRGKERGQEVRRQVGFCAEGLVCRKQGGYVATKWSVITQDSTDGSPVVQKSAPANKQASAGMVLGSEYVKRPRFCDCLPWDVCAKCQATALSSCPTDAIDSADVHYLILRLRKAGVTSASQGA